MKTINISMARGGVRPGSGRKPGKTLRLLDLLKKEDVDTFKEFLLSNYMEDSRLMIWMGDHIFGKAPQPITNADDGSPFVIQVTSSLAKKRGINTVSGSDS